MQSEFFKNTPLPILNNYFFKKLILKKNMKYMREKQKDRLRDGLWVSHIGRLQVRDFL